MWESKGRGQSLDLRSLRLKRNARMRLKRYYIAVSKQKISSHKLGKEREIEIIINEIKGQGH